MPPRAFKEIIFGIVCFWCWPLMMRFGHEIDKRNRCTNRQSGMTRFETTMLSVAAMSGAVEAAQFREVLRERREIAQD